MALTGPWKWGGLPAEVRQWGQVLVDNSERFKAGQKGQSLMVKGAGLGFRRPPRGCLGQGKWVFVLTEFSGVATLEKKAQEPLSG